MQTPSTAPILFQAGKLKFEIYENREAAGKAAALAAADAMRNALQLRKERDLGVIFATGASQMSMLHALTSIEGVPWQRIIGFHMDEYEAIAADHPASFRRYLRERLTERVPIKEFYEIDGNGDAEHTAAEYAVRLKAADPQLCLLGIGENGHMAFNDPFDADFDDPLDVKLVHLDKECREQQVAEGWFPNVEVVPARAITLTVPALFRVPKLIVSVPGNRKAKIVRRVVEEEISNACPSTLLKTHPDATVYLDNESSVEITDLLG
jgi:glucosamine-6-phosphate deaminase